MFRQRRRSLTSQGISQGGNDGLGLEWFLATPSHCLAAGDDDLAPWQGAIGSARLIAKRRARFAVPVYQKWFFA